MIVIPINAVTLSLVTELNNDVQPEIEGDTYFVWFKDQPARIVGHTEGTDIIYGDNPVMHDQMIHIRVAAM